MLITTKYTEGIACPMAGASSAFCRLDSVHAGKVIADVALMAELGKFYKPFANSESISTG